MKKILHFCMAHTKGRATIRLFLVLNMVVWGCLAAAFGAVLGCMMQVSANFFLQEIVALAGYGAAGVGFIGGVIFLFRNGY
ncbi:MAG TPA: hypothetical protein H9691_01110 [Firmicutes bacterium]|nr:hypothetical protein [Bacillota bacterium]